MEQKCESCSFLTYSSRSESLWCERYQKTISESYVSMTNYCREYAFSIKGVCFVKE